MSLYFRKIDSSEELNGIPLRVNACPPPPQREDSFYRGPRSSFGGSGYGGGAGFVTYNSSQEVQMQSQTLNGAVVSVLINFHPFPSADASSTPGDHDASGDKESLLNSLYRFQADEESKYDELAKRCDEMRRSAQI